ncbi:MAG TPA: hypothetical protein DD628_07045 [Clostridiales bacterium]|nr:hypothetical protein [Candidatus Apopatosoma intestinale]
MPRFWSLKSARREKLFYVSSRANDVRPYYAGRRGADPYKIKSEYSQQPKQKIYAYPLFLLHIQAQKKKLSKRKRRKKISRSAERDEDSASSTSQAFKKA